MAYDKRNPLPIGLLPVALVTVCTVVSLPPRARADALYQAARELRAKHTAQLEQLADWCDEQGLSDQAEKTRQVYGRQDPFKMYLPVLPREVGPKPLPAGASAELVEWHARITRLRRDQANELYEFARRAIRGRRASLAYQMVLAASRANPDHEAVRRILGYEKYAGRWHTFFELRQLRGGKVYHERFGWLPKSHVQRYEQGQRFTGRSWITAAQDAALHRDIDTGWLIETEHYAIRTNHSIEAGVQLGVKLERLFRYWEQLFIRYYASEAYVQALFDGRGRVRRVQIPRLRIVFFRDRDDYNRMLRAAMPNIEMSTGVYFQQAQRAYFFAGEGYEDRTLYHEATHQLFHQSRPVSPRVGMRSNFWIVEGIAMYMESLRREGDYYVLGGFDDDRMYAARYRLLQDNFYVPLAEFTTYGMERLQSDKRIATLYSQAAGLANFLIFYDSGRYRDALVAYLTTVYGGRDTPRTLSELTGVRYEDLDKQYRQFMEQSVRQGHLE